MVNESMMTIVASSIRTKMMDILPMPMADGRLSDSLNTSSSGAGSSTKTESRSSLLVSNVPRTEINILIAYEIQFEFCAQLDLLSLKLAAKHLGILLVHQQFIGRT